MDAAKEIRRFGNIATREQLMAAGVSGGDLTTAVRLGEVRRVRRAHYSTPAATADAVYATRVGGRLCGLSAARSYGLWSGFDPRLHVALPANASRLRTNRAPSSPLAQTLTPDIAGREVVLHWLATRSSNVECWRPSVQETLFQVASWCDRETAVACLDTARTVLGLDDRDITSGLAEGTPAVRMLGIRSVPGSDSGPESVVRQRLLALDIGVTQQVRIAGVGRVDMQVTGTNILIEVDGRNYHSDSVAFENDRRRLAELVRRGFVVIQFSYTQVFSDWPWCVSMVMGALSQFRSR